MFKWLVWCDLPGAPRVRIVRVHRPEDGTRYVAPYRDLMMAYWAIDTRALARVYVGF